MIAGSIGIKVFAVGIADIFIIIMHAKTQREVVCLLLSFVFGTTAHEKQYYYNNKVR